MNKITNDEDEFEFSPKISLREFRLKYCFHPLFGYPDISKVARLYIEWHLNQEIQDTKKGDHK
jgi:hypothetical protein